MKRTVLTPFVLMFVAGLPLAGMEEASGTARISGDYLEARTSDVYTGPCFANSEVNLAGQEAVLAWRIREGGWDGVPLAGLSLVAVVRASATLGDPHADPLPARSVLIVDERADPAERDALVGFARAMAGELLSGVVAVERAPIELSFAPPASAAQAGVAGAAAKGHEHHGHFGHPQGVPGLSGGATLRAGDTVELATRGLGPQDHLCGNEEVYYPPLVETAAAVPAVTLAHAWRGEGLGKTWSSPGKRSAFVGRFAHGPRPTTTP